MICPKDVLALPAGTPTRGVERVVRIICVPKKRIRRLEGEKHLGNDHLNAEMVF